MSRKPRIARTGFTLVEIMIVVAIIALLVAITVPGFLRARKRSQATTVKNELRMIDEAIAQYAIETHKNTGDPVHIDDWVDYVKRNSLLADTGQDLFGNEYYDQIVDELPTVPASTWDALSDVVDSDFWSPFPKENVPRAKNNKKKKKNRK